MDAQGEHGPTVTGPVRYLVEHLERALAAQAREVERLKAELAKAEEAHRMAHESIRKLTGWKA